MVAIISSNIIIIKYITHIYLSNCHTYFKYIKYIVYKYNINTCDKIIYSIIYKLYYIIKYADIYVYIYITYIIHIYITISLLI